jgi:hypothetical protein
MQQKKETLLAAVEAGIDAAFCSDDEKETLRKAVADFKNGNGVSVGNGAAFRDRVIDNKLIPGESM